MTMSAPEALLRTQVTDDQFAFLSSYMSTAAWDVSEAERLCSLPSGVGRRWLRLEPVQRALGELLRERKERHEGVRASVIMMLWRMICADPRRAYKSGCALPPDELPDEIAAVLTGAKPIIHEGVTVGWDYKFESKSKLIEIVLKHFDAPKDVRDGEHVARATIVFRGVQGALVEGSGE